MSLCTSNSRCEIDFYLVLGRSRRPSTELKGVLAARVIHVGTLRRLVGPLSTSSAVCESSSVRARAWVAHRPRRVGAVLRDGPAELLTLGGPAVAFAQIGIAQVRRRGPLLRSTALPPPWPSAERLGASP